jgi:hypothetical protein
MLNKMIRPDSKGRVMLGHLADGISGFSVSKGKNNQIILEPFVEIPAHEKWLFNNKLALKKVKKGLQDAASQQLFDLGTFSEYANDDKE